MPGSLNFYGWKRSGVYRTVPGPALTDGRLTGSVTLTLRNTEPPNEAVSHTVQFDILGPGDVRGLKPGTVVHMVPPPGTQDAEAEKCCHVDLAAADLPWRYTPRLAAGLVLQPWLALVVGTADEVQLQPGKTVLLAGAVLTQHPLASSARWAHIQEDPDHAGQQLVARLLSQRVLSARTAYIAVIVPAFTESGVPSWTPVTTMVTLPAYHSWHFATGEAGDFPSLAARLKAGLAPATLGQAPVRYTPLPASDVLAVRGALAPIGATDTPVAQPVQDDVAALTTPLIDPRRPVISVPEYGAAWIDNPAATTWGQTFHSDPRARGVGGLGLRAGIQEQDLLAAAAAAQAAALDIAAQRIRHLTLGVAAARGLWGRRLPADPLRQLAIFGPSLRRMMTKNGNVRDLATGPGRPLPAALFSTAARRVLRSGPARTNGAKSGANDFRAILIQANTCPPPPARSPAGLPHTDSLAKATGTQPLDELIEKGVDAKRLSPARLKELVARFDRTPFDPGLIAQFDHQMTVMLDRVEKGLPVPVLILLAILDPPGGKLSNEELRRLLALLDQTPDGQDLLNLGTLVLTRPPERPCQPVDLVKLANSVADAINPTVARPLIVDRVLGTIRGLDDQPLTPPELCPDLDLPAWKFLRDHAPDWLLPGANALAEDSVVAVQTNPTFVDAFLLGLNTQTLGELRFRNIPIVSGCTPLRQFWARTNPATESYDDDIIGIRNWAANTPLGSVQHQTPAAANADLVLVFRSPIFRRYPHTLVYLTPAPLGAGGQPDWAAEPDFANRLPPSFQGSITPDLTFFGFDLDPALGKTRWVVLEEPPHGVRFFNAPPPGFPPARVTAFNNATDGGTFAGAAFADPFRVLIRGQALIP